MWLRHSTERKLLRLILPGLALVMAGCASTGPASSAPDRGAASTGTPGAAGVEIPAQAQTMYEQAVAVMGSGDFLDAELRLKEFLLQFPRRFLSD